MLSQNEKPVGIVVHECLVLDGYSEILGDPVDYLKDKNNPKIDRNQKLLAIDKEKLKSYTDHNPKT